MNLYRVFGAGVILGLLLSLVLVGVDYYVPTKSVFIPGRPTALVDPLYPPGRWAPPCASGQDLIADPGYTDIVPLTGYKTIRVRVEYANPGAQKFALGFVAQAGLDLFPVEALQGTFELSYEFDKLARKEGRVVLIFSAPDLKTVSSAAPITIKKITVSYEDPVWHAAGFVKNISAYFRSFGSK
ncbi:MAG: hypothetical protein V1821_03580 [bacterium]